MANMREASKGHWTSSNTTADIDSGSRQRIADAAEEIAAQLRRVANVMECQNLRSAARAIVRLDKRLSKKYPLR